MRKLLGRSDSRKPRLDLRLGRARRALAAAGPLALRRRLSVPLVNENELTIVPGPSADQIEILDKGRACLKITVGPGGLSLELGTLELSLTPAGALKIEAERLELVGRCGIEMRSDTDLALTAAGALTTTADDQAIISRVGNVDIRANDDVNLAGERILLNS